MIFQYQVKQIAEDHLKAVLKDKTSIFRYVTRKPEFTKWVELATVRCNQLDLEGYVPTKWAMEDFVKKAAIAFAEKRLEKIESQALKAE